MTIEVPPFFLRTLRLDCLPSGRRLRESYLGESNQHKRKGSGIAQEWPVSTPSVNTPTHLCAHSCLPDAFVLPHSYTGAESPKPSHVRGEHQHESRNLNKQPGQKKLGDHRDCSGRRKLLRKLGKYITQRKKSNWKLNIMKIGGWNIKLKNYPRKKHMKQKIRKKIRWLGQEIQCPVFYGVSSWLMGFL